MSGINKVILVGNLGKDPETRYTQGGDPVCNFTVATSKKWKDKQSGESKEQTEWHRLVAFKRTAEVCAQYLKKGSKVYIEGELHYGSYDKEGVKHYTTEIRVREMQMLGGREQQQSQPPAGQPPADDFDDSVPF